MHLSRYDITVIVCVYNVEEYIEESLDSLFRQEGVRMQVILIDDASTDRSGEIADRYAAEHPGTVCVHHDENRGISYGRNEGIRMAKGTFITYFDPDDLLAEGIYAKLFRTALDKGCDVVVCRAARIRGEKVIPSYAHEKVFAHWKPVTHITEETDLIYDTTTWTKLVRRSFCRKHVPSYNEGYRTYEDIPVTAALHFLCRREAMVPEIGYFWRIREGSNLSITQHTFEVSSLEARLAVMRDVDAFLLEHGAGAPLSLAKQKKFLDVDLNIFLNRCKKLPEETALVFMRMIRDYVAANVDPSVPGMLSIVKHQKYACALADDLPGLLALLRFAEKDYALAPVAADPEAGKLSVVLPSDIFTVSRRDIAPEMEEAGPRVVLTKIEEEEAVLYLEGYAYYPRVSVPEKKQQKNTAWLFSMDTGKRKKLTAGRSREGVRLTNKKAEKPDERQPDFPPYDYSGTGFRIRLDLREIAEDREIRGEYRVLVRCVNPYLKGEACLGGAGRKIRERFEGRTDTAGDAVISWRFDPLGDLVLTVDREETKAEKARRAARLLKNRLRFYFP